MHEWVSTDNTTSVIVTSDGGEQTCRASMSFLLVNAVVVEQSRHALLDRGTGNQANATSDHAEFNLCFSCRGEAACEKGNSSGISLLVHLHHVP